MIAPSYSITGNRIQLKEIKELIITRCALILLYSTETRVLTKSNCIEFTAHDAMTNSHHLIRKEKH